MEASSGADVSPKPETIKAEVKPDIDLDVKPDIKLEVKRDPETSATSVTATITSNVMIKNEDADLEYAAKIDRSLPTVGGEDDIFEDVDNDEPEYVDLTYTGIAHVNGVRHFVCEGLFVGMAHLMCSNRQQGFKIRQIPEPYIVKRKLWDLHST